MLPEFKRLTDEERELLMKAPALVSVLASCSYNEVNQTKKRDAIKLAHLKTFTADPTLLPYYREVEKNFIDNFETTVEQYFPFDEVRRQQLIAEIEQVNKIIEKLDSHYAHILRKSLHKYANHVKNSTHSVFQDFLIPIYISGLNDSPTGVR